MMMIKMIKYINSKRKVFLLWRKKKRSLNQKLFQATDSSYFSSSSASSSFPNRLGIIIMLNVDNVRTKEDDDDKKA